MWSTREPCKYKTVDEYTYISNISPYSVYSPRFEKGHYDASSGGYQQEHHLQYR